MNVSADAPFVSRSGSNLAAGAMALGVHLVFVLLLVFGVSWQTRHPAPVMVDLWEPLPAIETPRPQPEPVVAPPAPPEPVKPEPVPQPAVKEPPPKVPDIALEKRKLEAERLQKLKAMQEAEDKALAETLRAEAEAARKTREKQLADQKKRELIRQMEEEDLMQRMAEEDAAREMRLMKQAEARAAASKRQIEVARIAKQNGDLISAKVHSNARLPNNLKGTPEVRFQVKLLPTGEVVSVRLSKSSGNLTFDEAVERAIYKSSPLPLPADREARSEFVPEFTLIHAP